MQRSWEIFSATYALLNPKSVSLYLIKLKQETKMTLHKNCICITGIILVMQILGHYSILTHLLIFFIFSDLGTNLFRRYLLLLLMKSWNLKNPVHQTNVQNPMNYLQHLSYNYRVDPVQLLKTGQPLLDLL